MSQQPTGDLSRFIAEVRALAQAVSQGDGAEVRRWAETWDRYEQVPKGLHLLARILTEEQAAQELDRPEKAHLKANPFPALWVKGAIYALLAASLGWAAYAWAQLHPNLLWLKLLGVFMMLSSPAALLVGRSRAVCPACAKVSHDFAEETLLSEDRLLRLHRCPACGQDYFRYQGIMLFERRLAPELVVPHAEALDRDKTQLGWLDQRDTLALSLPPR